MKVTNAIHVISLVPATDSSVVQVVSDVPKYSFHQLFYIDTTDLENSTRKLMDAVLELPVKVGQIVVLVTSAADVLEEHVISLTMLRRLQDSITFTICRDGKSTSIPYLPNLRQKFHDVDTNYRYSSGCGDCGGSCGSCK